MRIWTRFCTFEAMTSPDTEAADMGPALPGRYLWYHVLLVALAAMHVLAPFGLGNQLLLLTVLVVSVTVVRKSRAERLGAAVVMVAAAVLTSSFDPGEPAHIAGQVLAVLFFVFICFGLLRDLLAHRVVTAATLSGAISVYLLISMTFTLLYSIALYTHEEPAFAGLAIEPGNPDAPVRDLTYFSLVTISTLGYGDITPVQPITRTLATLEAVIGQVYLVVLVARFVALQIAHSGDLDRSS